MNANQIINMVIRMVTRRLINTGVNTGIDMMSRRGKSKEEMTPEDHARAQQGKDIAKRARQARRVTRRLF